MPMNKIGGLPSIDTLTVVSATHDNCTIPLPGAFRVTSKDPPLSSVSTTTHSLLPILELDL